MLLFSVVKKKTASGKKSEIKREADKIRKQQTKIVRDPLLIIV